jgi:hypothetical protein
MEERAAPVGPMHAWWDDIFDIRLLLAGQPEKMWFKWSAEQWIEESEKNLRSAGIEIPS